MFREAKLVALRCKADRELIFLLRTELARGLRFAEAALTKESEIYVQAERAYLMSRAWLRLVYDLGRDERRELEFRLENLKSVLERLHPKRCIETLRVRQRIRCTATADN